MKKLLFIVSLFITASLYAGQVTISRSVSSLASEYGWEQGNGNNCYLDFMLDENISIISASGNAKYLKETNKESLRYYQGSNKGQFTIRAKSGVIIQSVKFTYGVVNTGVVTSNYGSDGKSIASSNQRTSGTVYKVDANSLAFYTGTTGTNKDGQVRITDFEVKYFVPEEGVAITKGAKDLAYEFGLADGKAYQNIALNNAIKLHADNTGTLKYYTSGNFNCYRWTGSIDIMAREGVKIHYVKVTYSAGTTGTLTKNWGKDGKKIPEADRIASDSILYVNDNIVKLYVGNTNGTDATLGITKVYVNYTDSNAIVEEFRACTTLKSDTAVEVAGVDSIYNWTLTGFSRETSHHLYYDQTTQIYKGGSIVADNAEGGMKEVSFEWFSSNKDAGVKFYVKAGSTILNTVDSAKAGGYFPVTYTKTGVQSNGALAIEVDAASGAQVEVNHISIIPYLRFAVREDSVNTEVVKSYDVVTRLVDNTEDAANIVYTIESDATEGATINDGVVDLSNCLLDGPVVVKAAWESVTAHMTLHVTVKHTGTGIDNNNNLHLNRKQIVNGHVRIVRDGVNYSVLGEVVE